MLSGVYLLFVFLCDCVCLFICALCAVYCVMVYGLCLGVFAVSKCCV